MLLKIDQYKQVDFHGNQLLIYVPTINQWKQWGDRFQSQEGTIKFLMDVTFNNEKNKVFDSVEDIENTLTPQMLQDLVELITDCYSLKQKKS